MKGNESSLMSVLFFIIFCILTILCWCPIGYGGYGEVERLIGMPQWAAIALIIAAIFFVLQWIYLFCSDLAINDQDLPKMIAEIKEFSSQNPKESH